MAQYYLHSAYAGDGIDRRGGKAGGESHDQRPDAALCSEEQESIAESYLHDMDFTGTMNPYSSAASKPVRPGGPGVVAAHMNELLHAPDANQVLLHQSVNRMLPFEAGVYVPGLPG